MCASFKTGMERRDHLDRLRNENKLKESVLEYNKYESELILWMTNKKAHDRPGAQEILDSIKFKNWKNESESFSQK